MISTPTPKIVHSVFSVYRVARNFRQFHHLLLLSLVDDYIEDMATFNVLAKIYSTEFFCNTR